MAGMSEFRRVNDFKYLGPIINAKNNITKEVAAWNKSSSLMTLWSSPLFWEMKVKQLYITLIQSVILYKFETWTLKKTDETDTGKKNIMENFWINKK